MASLCVGVAAGSCGIGIGRGGGNPGGALGEATGIQDVLILLISLIRASIRVKYPNGTSSRWSRDSASNGFSSALSSCRLHFNVRFKMLKQQTLHYGKGLEYTIIRIRLQRSYQNQNIQLYGVMQKSTKINKRLRQLPP